MCTCSFISIVCNLYFAYYYTFPARFSAHLLSIHLCWVTIEAFVVSRLTTNCAISSEKMSIRNYNIFVRNGFLFLSSHLYSDSFSFRINYIYFKKFFLRFIEIVFGLRSTYGFILVIINDISKVFINIFVLCFVQSKEFNSLLYQLMLDDKYNTLIYNVSIDQFIMIIKTYHV